MKADPIYEWQRLAEHYRQMGDDELRELALDFANLTETAQQALRSEMHSRGLGDPQAADNAPKSSTFSNSAQPNSVFTPQPSPSTLADASSANADEDAASQRSIRRLPLYQCDDWKQAWQICEMLRREDIESWIQDARPDVEDSLVYSPEMGPPPVVISQHPFRVLVAADRLADAREVAAQPIPRDIATASEIDAPEFTAPKCPACGAEDPVLEAVDPENSWRCEQCGKEWTDSVKDAIGESSD